MDILDYTTTAGIALLMLFAPFASGGVEVWATGEIEAAAFALALLWTAKIAVSIRTGDAISLPASADFRALAAPVSALLLLIGWQLLPLPPALMRIASPHSYELYRHSLPGWPQRTIYEDPSYVHPAPHPNRAMTLLPTVEEVRGGRAIPFAPQAADAREAAAPIHARVWRSISIAPLLTRAGLLKAAAYSALFLIAIFYRPGSGDAHAERSLRRMLVLIVMVSAAAVAIAGLWQQALMYGGTLAGAAAGTRRASGPFFNPDHFANYLAMVLPLVLAGALFRAPLDRTAGFSGFQLLCAAAALLMAAAIVLSLSRAGWIEIGLGALVFAWMLRARRFDREAQSDSGRAAQPHRTGSWLLAMSAGLIAIAAVALTIVGTAGREDAGARVAQSVSGGVGFWDRIEMWIDSAAIVRDYPVFGAGFDSWPNIFARYQRPPWTVFFAGEAQNDYVEVAAETGILGLAAFGWLCWAAGRKLYQASISIPARHWPVFAALIAAIAIMAFHETLDFCMQIPANAVLFVLVAGLALRLARTYGGAPIRPASTAATLALPAAIALAAAAGLAAVAGQRETVYPDDIPYPAGLSQNAAAILAHPASPIPHLWLADRVHASTGVWLTPELKAAIYLDPTNPAGRDRYIQALLSQNKKAQALQEISTAVLDAPGLGTHGYLNERLLMWLSKDERAAMELGLRRGAALGYAGSADSLARLYLVEGRQLDCAAVYENAAHSGVNESQRFDYLLSAGQLYARLGQRAQAERLFKAAAEIRPEEPRPYLSLIAQVYAPAKNLGAAHSMVAQAVLKGAPAAPLYNALFEAAAAAGDYPVAEAAARAIVRDDPSYANLIRMAAFYIGRGQFNTAEALVRQALEINPNSGEAYFYLAQSEEGALRYREAWADYQRAIALSPGNDGFKTRSLVLLDKIAAQTGGSH